MSCSVVAFGASSPLGEGARALGVADVGERATSAVARASELEEAGLLRPFAGRVRIFDALPGDRAALLLERALADCARELDAALPGWRARRVGLALGTSSGGMRAFEALFAGGAADGGPADSAMGATYLGPLLAAARPCDLSPVALVLGACASGSLAIGLAREWLLAGACDVALAGGVDALSVFVASGFEALRAVCSDGSPRPFRAGRDGLALGEGAAVLALVRDVDAAAGARKPMGRVVGFGASCDALHLTAPCRDGRGLARAARAALEDAGEPRVELVSAHGTATVFNDASEAQALAAVLGPRLGEVPVHALKGQIGHALGAAGALETLAALVALERGIAPASAGTGAVEGGVRVLERSEPHAARAALKLSAAFGGANAALVLARASEPSGVGLVDDGRPTGAGARRRAPRAIHVSRAVAISDPRAAATQARELAARTGYSEDKLARADDLVRLAVAAVEALRASLDDGAFAGAGVLVGHGLATLDTNAAYLARLRAAGASRAEPRRFPYTTPNAAAGECAVAFGLTGPSFAVGGGPHGGVEALAVAADLVRGGIAARMVVVAVDDAGPVSRRLAPDTRGGAVALLVGGEPAAARLVSWSSGLARGGPAVLRPPRAMDAHRALLPLVDGRPAHVEALTPWGGFAKVGLFWL